MKACSKCKTEKDQSEFSKNRSKKDGLQDSCKTCKVEQYQDNRTEILEKQRGYQQTPAGKAAHSRANKKYNQTPAGKESHCRGSKKSHSTIKGYLCTVFFNMKRRCTDPKAKSYNRYGGRGIMVCFESLDDFRNYVIDVLKADPRGLQIDRINNDGNYEVGNIRFVTCLENNQNKG